MNKNISDVYVSERLFIILICIVMEIMSSMTEEQVFFGSVQFSEFANLGFRKSLIFGIRRCRILTNSNKSKFSRKANAQVLSTSTQFPQLVCLQNSTIITSAKTCNGVTGGPRCITVRFPFSCCIRCCSVKPMV